MKGRKPKPTSLRLLNNNPGKRAFNLEEPIPGELSAECPEELFDDVARAEWSRTIVPAIAVGQVTESDRVLAIAHCELWATWRSQVAEASKYSHVVATGPNKYPTPNPARGMANKTFQLLVKVDAELGFSPTSRSRVQVKGPKLQKGKGRLDHARARFAVGTRG